MCQSAPTPEGFCAFLEGEEGAKKVDIFRLVLVRKSSANARREIGRKGHPFFSPSVLFQLAFGLTSANHFPNILLSLSHVSLDNSALFAPHRPHFLSALCSPLAGPSRPFGVSFTSFWRTGRVPLAYLPRIFRPLLAQRSTGIR